MMTVPKNLIKFNFNIYYLIFFNISIASIWTFLLWTVTNLSLEKNVLQMIRDYLYKQFLMPSHQFYYDLSFCYELTRLVDKVLAVGLAIGNFGNCG